MSQKSQNTQTVGIVGGWLLSFILWYFKYMFFSVETLSDDYQS